MKQTKLKLISDNLPRKIIEVREDRAKEMLKNKDCILFNEKEKPKKENKINYDLNNDGKFDEKDKSIAGKVLRKKYDK